MAVIELAPRFHLGPGTYNLHKRIHKLVIGSYVGPNPLRPHSVGPRGLPGGSLNAKKTLGNTSLSYFILPLSSPRVRGIGGDCGRRLGFEDPSLEAPVLSMAPRRRKPDDPPPDYGESLASPLCSSPHSFPVRPACLPRALSPAGPPPPRAPSPAGGLPPRALSPAGGPPTRAPSPVGHGEDPRSLPVRSLASPSAGACTRSL